MNRAHDRCDKCSAQAFVRVGKPVQPLPGATEVWDLLFCGHHFQENEPALLAQGFTIAEDERESINVKPSISANAE